MVKCCNSNENIRKAEHPYELKEKLVKRLNRVQGQINGIKNMVDKDIYCDDILNQIAAATSALKSVGMLLLEAHLKSCVITQIQNGNEEVVDELLKTFNKLTK